MAQCSDTPISYDTAQTDVANVLRRLTYPEKKARFFAKLAAQEATIKAIVAHHLGAPSASRCIIEPVAQWYHGSYNVCIPVKAVFGPRYEPQHVLLRVPLPYKVGEDYRPGNSDEKLRCEAATYAWLEDNCPDIPTPLLYGFGFSDGTNVSHVATVLFEMLGD